LQVGPLTPPGSATPAITNRKNRTTSAPNHAHHSPAPRPFPVRCYPTTCYRAPTGSAPRTTTSPLPPQWLRRAPANTPSLDGGTAQSPRARFPSPKRTPMAGWARATAPPHPSDPSVPGSASLQPGRSFFLINPGRRPPTYVAWKTCPRFLLGSFLSPGRSQEVGSAHRKCRRHLILGGRDRLSSPVRPPDSLVFRRRLRMVSKRKGRVKPRLRGWIAG